MIKEKSGRKHGWQVYRIKTHWSLSVYGLAEETTELWQGCKNNSWLTFFPHSTLWGCIIHHRCSHTGAAGWSASKNLILNVWKYTNTSIIICAAHARSIPHTQRHKVILTSESELSSSARLGAFRSLFLWGTDWDPEGSALGDADPLVRDRVLDVLLPMYGLNSSAQSHTKERVIQTRRGEALGMNLRTIPHMIHCTLCYSFNLLWLLCPRKRVNFNFQITLCLMRG